MAADFVPTSPVSQTFLAFQVVNRSVIMLALFALELLQKPRAPGIGSYFFGVCTTYFYGPLYLTVISSVLVTLRSTGICLFWETTSGAVSAFLGRQRIHGHVTRAHASVPGFGRNYTFCYVKVDLGTVMSG